MPGKEIEQPYGPGFLLMQDNSGQLVIEDAHIIFRNFAGKEGQYNREGDRNFCVVLPPEIAEQMIEDEWNVKQLKSRDGGETPGDFYIQVSVGFKGRPPNIFLISSKGRVHLGQHEVEVLDWVDIGKADIVVNPYRWSVSGKSGVKAYVKTLAVTMVEDYLELKYADVPDANEPLAIEAGAQEASVVGHTDDGEPIYEGELVD
jgi:hypothetical protein